MTDGKGQNVDLEHLTWAIDKRAEIQHTLLALYGECLEHHPAAQSGFEYQHMLSII